MPNTTMSESRYTRQYCYTPCDYMDDSKGRPVVFHQTSYICVQCQMRVCRRHWNMHNREYHSDGGTE